MSMLPMAIIYSQDEDLLRRVRAFLEATLTLQHVAKGTGLLAALARTDPVVVLFDLIAENAADLLTSIRRDTPDSAIIALGLPGSDTFLEAEDAGVFAAESTQFERRRLQTTVQRAQALVDLVRRNRVLTARLHQERTPATTALPAATPPVWQLSRAFRYFDNIPAVCDNIVDCVSEQTKVSRVGLFAMGREDAEYRLWAGLNCIEESRTLRMPTASPLVRWLDLQAHIVSRSMLAQTTEPSQEMLLRQALDAMGAETLVPLHGRNRLLGWLLMGHRATGVPLSASEIDNLSLLGGQVAMTLENAFLFEEAAVQRKRVETILHSIPIGIVAVDASGTVRGFNPAAERMLEATAPRVIGESMHKLHNRLVDLLTRALAGDSGIEQSEWTNPANQRTISATVHRLQDGDHYMGTVAIIHDLTRERLLREKQDHLDRAVFWTELAAAISHEVRNPLVAISTFAQLLPERFDDEEFRNQFRELATSEIGRLDRMVNQINAFANPPPLVFQKLEVGALLTQAVAAAQQQMNSPKIEVRKTVTPDTPVVYGDEHALVESFTHLIANAFEALAGRPQPTVVVMASGSAGERDSRSAVIRIDDNGGGIPPDIREKIFSPFCTSKARGIGLGLPIVQRTLTDHNGHLAISTGPKGTAMTVVLPAYNATREADSRRSQRGTP